MRSTQGNKPAQMNVKCGLVAFAVVLGAVVPASAASRYDDSPCRGGRTSWTNDACAGRQWGLARIAAPQAWRLTRGGGVRVAVVDTGVDFRHPDLRKRLVAVRGSDLTRNTAYRCPYERSRGGRRSRAVAADDNGHGTHVAGVVAARAGNDIGVAGVAPNARVVPVKVLDKKGSGTDAAVARGICFAVAQKARVINLSLGEDPLTQLLIEGSGRLTARAIDHAHKRGRVVVVAGGNDSFPLCGFHSVREQALCVGAVDHNDLKARYSNFGDAAAVMAPGGFGGLQCRDDGDVWSTIWPKSPDDCSHRGYQPLAGTSMAAPHVAGAAALIVARFGRRATPAFVYARLRATADDLGLPGADPLFGAGRINAARAVQ
jgi:subtilisin family serine protease